MKSFIKTTVLASVFILATVWQANSQSIRLLGGDLANGAMNGLALGGATMALQDSDDRSPLRVGLGLGILYGLGVGIYDNSIVPKGQPFYISGTFNDGRNSTVLVFLDTVYGAAGGAAIGGAITLVANDPILEGLQYGAGAGAWIGFGFGLIDAFVLAEGPDDLQASRLGSRSGASGLVQIHPAGSEAVSLGFLNPQIVSHKVVDSNTLRIRNTMSMQLVNLKVGL